MNTTQSVGALAGRAHRAAGSAPNGPALDQVPTPRELALLESAHEQLLRRVQDLKHIYTVERERRARLARSTMDLVTVLSRTEASSAFGLPRPTDSEAVGGA